MLNNIIDTLQSADRETLSRKIIFKEVAKVIHEIIMKKSLSFDKFLKKFYRALLNDSQKINKEIWIMRKFTTLFNKVFLKLKLLKDWTNDVLSIIYKNKENKKNLKFYRSLFIMRANYKLYITILMWKLIDVLKKVINEHQYVFLFDKLINDDIKTVQQLIGQMKIQKQTYSIFMTIVFLKQKKTYDKVSHDFLWKAMRRINLSMKFISVIKTVYSDAFLRLFMNE